MNPTDNPGIKGGAAVENPAVAVVAPAVTVPSVGGLGTTSVALATLVAAVAIFAAVSVGVLAAVVVDTFFAVATHVAAIFDS